MAKSEEDIKKFCKLQNKGKVDIYYYDESSFSLESNIPYGWQKLREYIKIPSSKSKSIKVMGFLNTKEKKIKSYMTTDNINSDLLIATFDDFSNQIEKPTIVILDNAPTHRSGKFQNKINEWKMRGLNLYFLPPYSPNLNKIEILWKFMKYYWFEVKNYSSIDTLWNYLEKVLSQFNKNSNYVINFG